MSRTAATSKTTDSTRQGEPLSGFAFALGAYLLWGGLPFYMKAVDHMPAWEVVAHRVVWSVPVAGVIILLLGRTADLKAAFRSPRTIALAALTAGLISVNWGIYVWAISVERTLETALGYYINPLVNVVLGAVFLGERFSRLQLAAIALAVIAVGILTVKAGGLPWVSLALAGSFGLYGYLRKTLPIGPTQGFMLEVLLLSIPAVAIIGWMVASGTSHFGQVGGARDIGLLMLAGPVTAVPLILYAFGAEALRYATIGILQYLAPTLIFLTAVFVFGEPFSHWQLIAFIFIWSALVLYTLSLFRR
ncbi:EamA family transporter RarD [Oricola thermophila]|uniref:EamA family transporter RarD n=1 Tax=Oricola thermophila TaxID=2742145 RepID=A0A6N1VCP0_9HYPH|nr:EamA family transporter RarD [Oricola thermophila]QKV18448.1 EamA family transporter RarD [Oricola thermophila]